MHDNEIKFEALLANQPEFLDYLKKQEPAFQQNLLQEVDESSFPLADWGKSLILLNQWLDERGLTLSAENCLGYVSCAAKAVGDSSGLSNLPSVVSEFLEQYGCERAVKNPVRQSRDQI